MKNLPNISYINTYKNPTVDSSDSSYMIEYFKTSEYFSNLEAYNAFIKDVEKIVRNHKRYKAYIKFLKNEVKLNRCQVINKLNDTNCTIEMHHGPIFTLFDICSIILDYFLIKNRKINTFRIAEVVLDEHHLHNVQIVMLSKTVHEQVHARNIFINNSQAYGDLNTFLKKYNIAISDYYKEKYNAYIDRSMMQTSDDNDTFKLNDYLLTGGK